MTEDRREQVRRALALEDGGAMAAAIDAFSDAEQLHQFLANYNVNDGFLPCLAIARHPSCDRGTATWLYFQFADLFGDEAARAEHRTRDDRWNADAVMTLLEERFATARFASADFLFDPAEWLGLDESALRRFSVPANVLRPVGVRRVERLWLL
jgi:hypothetical protein